MNGMASKPTILIISTLDTKLPETLYLRSAILEHGQCQTQILDVSRVSKVGENEAQIYKDELICPLRDSNEELSRLDRGKYVDRAIQICTPVVQDLVSNDKLHGIVSAAGSTGSSLATAIMRHACPVGFPKLMLSTMASGDIKPYIEGQSYHTEFQVWLTRIQRPTLQ